MLLLQKYRFLRRGQNKLPFFFEDKGSERVQRLPKKEGRLVAEAVF